jgi:hypothetical protein
VLHIIASFVVSSPTTAKKSLFPAASDLVRPIRGVHQFPGETAPLFPSLLRPVFSLFGVAKI